jgi:hypothetical protein
MHERSAGDRIWLLVGGADYFAGDSCIVDYAFEGREVDMPLVVDFLAVLLVAIACSILLAMSNGLIVPHSEQVKQESSEEEAPL